MKHLLEITEITWHFIFHFRKNERKERGKEEKGELEEDITKVNLRERSWKEMTENK